MQAHSFIVFLHPNAAMRRQLIRLKPISRGRMSNSCGSGRGKKVLLLCHRGFIYGEWLSCGLLILKCRLPLTSLQLTANQHCFFIYVLISESIGIQKQWCLTSNGIPHNILSLVLLYPVWQCVVVYLAVLADSGSAVADGIVLTGQTSQADRAQSGQLPLGFWRWSGGGGRGLDLTAFSQIKKGDLGWLRKAVRLLFFPPYFALL